jgi:outer membrane protein assembly factor BamB
MRLFGILAGIGLVLTLMVGCRGPLVGDEWAGIVSRSALAKASLKYYWRGKIELEEEETLARIWRLEENLYALTSSGRLVALDAAAGTYKWELKVAGPAQQVFDPCHTANVSLPVEPLAEAPPGAEAAEEEGLEPVVERPEKAFNTVLINTLTYALLIDRDKGELLRTIAFPFAANTRCTCDGRFLYVCSVKGWYYSISLRSGLARWTMGTKDLVSAAPVYFSGRLFVASQDAKFYAIDPEAEKNRHSWTQETDGPLTADFVIDARGCFVPSQDYKLYAYDVAVGEDLWQFRTQGPLMRPVQVGERTVYQFAEKDRFYAIDLANGRGRWESDEGRLVLASVDGRQLSGIEHEDQPYVFVLTADRYLLMIPESLGDVELRLPLTGLELFVPNASKPLIYAATADGKVACISPAAVRDISPDMLR